MAAYTLFGTAALYAIDLTKPLVFTADAATSPPWVNSLTPFL